MDKDFRKNIILDLYFKKHATIDYIASLKIINLSKPAILNILRKDEERYKKERQSRIKKASLEKEARYKKIQELYYFLKLSPTQIANALGVSKSMVTRAIKELPEYELEKEQRLGSTKQTDPVIEFLLKQQRSHSLAMSKTTKISTDMAIRLSLNHYTYNNDKQRLEFNERSGKRPSDLPKFKSIHNFKRGC